MIVSEGLRPVSQYIYIYIYLVGVRTEAMREECKLLSGLRKHLAAIGFLIYTGQLLFLLHFSASFLFVLAL